MKKLFILLLPLFIFTACHKGQKQQGPSEAELRKADSLALHVAVYPSECCLPLYVAKETGIFDSLKVDVRLMYLSTMEDCDTALIHHRADVSASDIARLICMRRDQFRATALASLPTSLSIFTARGKRIKEIAQLKDRIIAMDRHSETDYWSDKMLEGTKVERLEVFRTQFNRHKLRQEMLSGGLVDAAFLDQPFAAMAKVDGARSIWTRDDDKGQAWTILASSTSVAGDKRKMEQTRKVLEGYRLAVDRLNGDSTLRSTINGILYEHFGFPQAALDTLPLWHSTTFHHAESLHEATIETARTWLIGRGWITKHLSIDSINSPVL